MRNAILLSASVLVLAGCGKVGLAGHISQAFGNWAEVRLPDDCKARQISTEKSSGVAVLCEDGRVFH